jgi:hypothetical protein
MGTSTATATNEIQNSILRITQDGQPVVVIDGGGDGGTLGNSFPLNLYYAYGIRNSLDLTLIL